MGQENGAGTRVFISYSHADSVSVDQLQRTLESAGLQVWRDTADLWPGQDWRARTRQAITTNALVFVACFSTRSVARVSSFQNEELTLAVEETRKRSVTVPWIIPVRFDDCEIPDLDLGGGRLLSSIHRADLFGTDAARHSERLVASICELAGKPAADLVPHRSRPASTGTIGGNAGRRLDVLDIRSSHWLLQPVVDLMDKQAGVFLTLRVSPAEAVSIDYARKGIPAEPDPAHSASYVLPHDLLIRALEAVGQPLASAEMAGGPDRTLLARLTFADEQTTVISPPADAIALALRAGIPLVASAGLLGQAGSGTPGRHDNQAWRGSAPKFDRIPARSPAGPASPAPDTVLVTVAGIGTGEEPDEPMALLEARPAGWTAPVPVSPIEAVAIEATRRGELSRCPPVYPLFQDLLSKAGAVLLAVLITARSDGTPVAQLRFSVGQPVPARVGDSLALAQLTGANIFAPADLAEGCSRLTGHYASALLDWGPSGWHDRGGESGDYRRI